MVLLLVYTTIPERKKFSPIALIRRKTPRANKIILYARHDQPFSACKPLSNIFMPWGATRSWSLSLNDVWRRSWEGESESCPIPEFCISLGHTGCWTTGVPAQAHIHQAVGHSQSSTGLNFHSHTHRQTFLIQWELEAFRSDFHDSEAYNFVGRGCASLTWDIWKAKACSSSKLHLVFGYLSCRSAISRMNACAAPLYGKCVLI